MSVVCPFRVGATGAAPTIQYALASARPQPAIARVFGIGPSWTAIEPQRTTIGTGGSVTGADTGAASGSLWSTCDDCEALCGDEVVAIG